MTGAFGDDALEIEPSRQVLHAANVGSEAPGLTALFEGQLDLEIEPREAVREFFDSAPALATRLNLSRTDFHVAVVLDRPLQDRIIATAKQKRHDLFVEFAIVQFSFERSTGRLLLLSFHDLRDWIFHPRAPQLPKEGAEIAAIEGASADQIVRDTRLIYAADGSEAVFRLAWEVHVTKSGALESLAVPKRVLVDAFTGEILRQQGLLLNFDAPGTVTGFCTHKASTLPDYSGNPPQEQPVEGLKVTAAPGGEHSYTQQDGSFSITTSSSPVTVDATLQHSEFLTNSDSPLASDQETGLQGLTLVLNDDPQSPERDRFTAQLNCWQWIMICRNFLDTIYGRTQIPFLTDPEFEPNCSKWSIYNPPPAHVKWVLQIIPNLPATCGNAGFGDGFCPFAFLFNGEGTNHHNPAYSTIIAHEFGHYFHLEMTTAGASSHNPIHMEAIGDILSSFVNETEVMGNGFQKGQESRSFFRNLETGVSVTDWCVSEWEYSGGHDVWPGEPGSTQMLALPYSGAWWDLRKALIQNYPNGKQIAEDLLISYYDTKLSVPLTKPSYVIANELLSIDDTPYFGGDNSMANGTPHMAEIIEAFVGRNLYLKDFKRGDANSDDLVNVADTSFIRNYLFCSTPPCPAPACFDSADTNDDGRLDISDFLYLFNWLFNGGPEPPAPGPYSCGTDVATWEDSLTCLEYQPCGN